MSLVTTLYRFLVRGGTAANLATVNETPLARELIAATDTGKLKLGDGVTPYNSLPYLNPDAPAAPCFQYTTDTGSTADSDPGAGMMKWNNATQGSTTALYFDDVDAVTGTDLSAFFSELVASSSAGIIHLSTEDGGFQAYKWTAITDRTGYFKFSVASMAASGSFADNVFVRVVFYPMPPGGGGGATPAWSLVKKTSDETVSSSTTFQDDDELQIALAANARYVVRAKVFFSTTAAADFKYQAAYTGTFDSTGNNTFFERRYSAPGSAVSATNVLENRISGSLPATGITGSAGLGWFDFDLVIKTTTAGSLKIQWAQNTSDAAATTVLAGSRIEYQTF